MFQTTNQFRYVQHQVLWGPRPPQNPKLQKKTQQFGKLASGLPCFTLQAQHKAPWQHPYTSRSKKKASGTKTNVAMDHLHPSSISRCFVSMFFPLNHLYLVVVDSPWSPIPSSRKCLVHRKRCTSQALMVALKVMTSTFSASLKRPKAWGCAQQCLAGWPILRNFT